MARVGIIGRGWGKRVQEPLFREGGLEVVATATRDWREVVAAPDIDLVSIVVPPTEHAEIAIAALEAGKHVLCEKPTAMDSAQAEAMLRAARSRPGQLALIDHELRFLPSWQEAQVRMTELGALRFIEARYCSPSRGDRERAWNWWSDASRGGGVLGAVGSHFFDAFRFLAGEILEVRATLHTFIQERPHEDDWRRVTADDFAALHVRFTSGALGLITLAVVATVDEPATITLHGENGGMRLAGERLEMASLGGSWTTAVEGDLQRLPGNSPGGAYGTGTLLIARALRRALDEHDADALAPAATFHDGLMQQRCLDAARASAGSGGWVGV